MKTIILGSVLLTLFIGSVPIEAGETCEAGRLHSSALYCKGLTSAPPDMAECCEATCSYCHDGVPADLCVDCHEERFVQRDNHPVDIVYAPGANRANLKSSPVGPYLDCSAATGGSCLVRCVSCHKLHPDESDGNQVKGLLRVKTAGSELCLRCHDK